MPHVSRFIAVGAFAAAVMIPGAAFAQGERRSSLGGFGGLTMSTFDSQRPSLGGTLTFEVTPNIQVIGEAGRLGNVLPTISDTVFSATHTGLRASAFYGEGGVRLLAAPSSNITPYGEATFGMARVDVTSDKFGTVGDAVSSILLSLAGRTSPVAGVGGGFLVRTGPVVFDLGYRYKQLFANDVLEAALGFGQPLRAHQLRVGVGVRF